MPNLYRIPRDKNQPIQAGPTKSRTSPYVRFWPKADIHHRNFGQAGLDNSKASCLMSAYDPKRTFNL